MHTEVWWGNLESGHYKNQSQYAVWMNKNKNCLQWWTWVLELVEPLGSNFRGCGSTVIFGKKYSSCNTSYFCGDSYIILGIGVAI
jgi:hypothetical protein